MGANHLGTFALGWVTVGGYVPISFSDGDAGGEGCRLPVTGLVWGASEII